jgi:hypothetical protein
MYIDPYNFLPAGTINTIRSSGAWGIPDDDTWENTILNLETQGLGVIKARINFGKIEKEHELIADLLSEFVMYKLLLPLIHMNTLRENGQYAYEKFESMLADIKENQAEAGIIADEDIGVPNESLIVF